MGRPIYEIASVPLIILRQPGGFFLNNLNDSNNQIHPPKKVIPAITIEVLTVRIPLAGISTVLNRIKKGTSPMDDITYDIVEFISLTKSSTILKHKTRPVTRVNAILMAIAKGILGSPVVMVIINTPEIIGNEEYFKILYHFIISAFKIIL